MDILKELEDYMSDEEERMEEIQQIVDYSKKVMQQLGKTVFDDDVLDKVGRMFGFEYLGDKLDEVIAALGVENKLTY